MKVMKPIINYVGWIGHGNLGDEGSYRVNKEIFQPYKFKEDLALLKPIKKFLSVLNKISLPHFFRLESQIADLYSPITIFGGGTVIPEWVRLIKPNKINYAYGVGVRNPEFWGKYPTDLIEKLKQFKFRVFGVRGYISRDILENWRIKSEVIGDPCLLLKPTNSFERHARRIAINIGSDGVIWGDETSVFTEVLKICKALKKRRYQPVLLPFCKYDVKSISKIAEYTKTPIFREWRDIEKTINFIASCHVLIGQRLHSCVFSAATYTPFITLEYRPKCRDFTESLNIEGYSIRTDNVTCKKILKTFYSLEDNWDTLHKMLFKKVNFYREKLKRCGDKIKKDIGKLYPADM